MKSLGMNNVTPLESTYPLIIAGIFGIFGQFSASFMLKKWNVRKLQVTVFVSCRDLMCRAFWFWVCCLCWWELALDGAGMSQWACRGRLVFFSFSTWLSSSPTVGRVQLSTFSLPLCFPKRSCLSVMEFVRAWGNLEALSGPLSMFHWYNLWVWRE